MTPELERAAATLTREHVRAGEPRYALALVPTTSSRFAPDSFLVLMYLLGFGILAIGCSNVTALTLARGLTRRRDFALRIALGAPRRAIAREVFAEVGVVTFAGSVLGMGVTFALLGVLGRSMPVELTWQGWAAPALDVATLTYCAIAFFVAVAMGGTLPAIRATRVSPNESLKDGAGTTTGRARSEFRLLIIGELAVAMVLIMMASLLTLSLRHVMTFDFGFSAHTVVTASIRANDRQPQASAVEIAAWQQRSLDVARDLPGVLVAGLGGGYVPAGVVISDGSGSGEPSLNTRSVRGAGAGYFTAMGVPILAGRDFLEGDVTGRGGAILSASAAQALFPYGGAVGRMVKVGAIESDAPWVPVVGVAGNFWTNPTDSPEEMDPLVTVALPGQPSPSWTIVVRGDTAAQALVAPLRLGLMDALPPRSAVTTSAFAQDFEYIVRAMRYFVQVFAALGFAALALGALGLFSVMSYAVGQRSREFAVRVSLGATPSNVLRVVLRSAAELALGGAAIGALLSFWASAGLSAALFGVKNTDPVSLIVSEAALIGVCLLASLGPALRASRANPLEVIRAV
jgi:predicted permease